MKPLLLTPIYKDYIWGGEKLVKEYGKETDIRPVAESWELSCHPDGLTKIRGGEFDGMTLCEYIKTHKGCLGTASPSEELPILIKLIDACDKLSVQVHPNDEQAKVRENQNGKTELWYVVDAEEYDYARVGKDGKLRPLHIEKGVEASVLTPPKLKEIKTLDDGTRLIGECEYFSVRELKLDGEYSSIANSKSDAKITYGVKKEITKDELRKSIENNTVEELLNTVNSKKGDVFFVEAGTIHAIGKRNLIAEIQQNSNVTYRLYVALLVADGSAILESEDFSHILSKGETVFIPAGLGKFSLNGKATLLITTNKYLN